MICMAGFDFVTLLQFIVAIAFLAALHEFGHFIMAKLAKIEIEEFGLGMPPRLFKLFTWQRTDFTINALPFGAFVRPKGEDDPNIPNGLAAAKPLRRFSVIFGGPAFNLLIAILIFSMVFGFNGVVDSIDVLVQRVDENSPAAVAGFQPGDIIRKVENHEVSSFEDISTVVNANAGQDVSITLERNGQPVDITVIPRVNPPQGQGRMGIVMEANPIYKPVSAIQATALGIREVASITAQLFLLPVRLIEGVISPEQTRVVSIVGAFQMFKQVSDYEAQTAATSPGSSDMIVLHFLGLLSVAIGVTQLLPLPALDGGRILFIIFEIIFRKRVPHQLENAVHGIGFGLLLLLMVALVVNDLLNPIVIR